MPYISFFTIRPFATDKYSIFAFTCFCADHWLAAILYCTQTACVLYTILLLCNCKGTFLVQFIHFRHFRPWYFIISAIFHFCLSFRQNIKCLLYAQVDLVLEIRFIECCYLLLAICTTFLVFHFTEIWNTNLLINMLY